MRTVMHWLWIGCLAAGIWPSASVAAGGEQRESTPAKIETLENQSLRSARAPLPYTEEARVQRLREVAATYQLTAVEARHAADTQLLIGALVMVGSMLTPLIAEVRDEDFPALGSILVGSIGLFMVIEGTIDERDAKRLQLQEDLETERGTKKNADATITDPTKRTGG